MVIPILGDILYGGYALLTREGCFAYFTNYNDNNTYCVEVMAIKWKRNGIETYCLQYSVTENGFYYEEDFMNSEHTVRCIGI